MISPTRISSTIRAGRAEKMKMRSARNTASSTSWVTKITAFFSMRLISRSWYWRNSRVWASRAPKGSSISRMSGPAASVRAMATRWRIPPEIRFT